MKSKLKLKPRNVGTKKNSRPCPLKGSVPPIHIDWNCPQGAVMDVIKVMSNGLSPQDRTDMIVNVGVFCFAALTADKFEQKPRAWVHEMSDMLCKTLYDWSEKRFGKKNEPTAQTLAV